MRYGCLWLAIALSLMLAGAPGTSGAAPYEPNETSIEASGPLLLHQSYGASLETQSDKDFYFFHVTSPQSQIRLTITNQGGGGSVSYIAVKIVDASMTPIAAHSYIDNGEARLIELVLEPQKYFVEVAANEGFGDAYVLTAEGTDGAFGSYALISGKCMTATTAFEAAKKSLRRAEAKLQRTTARVRRSRYGPRNARKDAQAVHRKARARAASKRRALGVARKSRAPWCLIPQ